MGHGDLLLMARTYFLGIRLLPVEYFLGLTLLSSWHHDIDPSNILVFSRNHDSPYDCDFKIADLGLAHFKRYESSLAHATDDNRYGTKTYGERSLSMLLWKSFADTSAGAPETHRGRNLQTIHLQAPQTADIWSMGCIFSEVATWISEGKPKLLEYRRRRKQEILEKSKTVSEDCFHYLSKVLETVTQIHIEIRENGRTNDYITPSVIRELVNGMIRPNPSSRASAQYLVESSVNILKEAEVKPKRALPDSPAPNPGHTSSDSDINITTRRLPPNLPPGRGHQIPARSSDVWENASRSLQSAELHEAPPISVWQGFNPLQQGHAVQNFGELGDQQGREPFEVHSDISTAQKENPSAYRPSQRIVSHPAASSVQSQQHVRSSTSTAGVTGRYPNSRPLGALVDTYDTTNAMFLPQRPRDYGATNNDLSASRAESNDESSEFANPKRADPANSNHTSFQDHQPTISGTHTGSPVGRQPVPHQRPHPTMSVEQGLKIKKAKRSNRIDYPGEDDFRTTDDILKKRDHVRESNMCYLSSKLTISLGFPHR